MGVGGWVVIVLVKKQKNLETKINKILKIPPPTQSSIFILNLWWELLLTQFFFSPFGYGTTHASIHYNFFSQACSCAQLNLFLNFTRTRTHVFN